MELIIARHGETAWNVEEIFRGRLDVELNETGTKQAELLAEYLSHSDIKAVYSSPLKRALKTAEMIAGYHHLNVKTTPGLTDFDFGEWQGLSHEKVKERYQGLYEKWVSRPDRVKIPAGESLQDVRKRATVVVDEIVNRIIGGSVVLVAHRVVNKVLICALLGLDNSHFWDIRQDNGAITVFTLGKGRFILTRHNDTSYLASLPQTRLADF
jgi:broad specificity phosphatase PhoE